jgi:hypothetical protein
MLSFIPDEHRKSTDILVAALQPVPWLREIAGLMRKQLFGHGDQEVRYVALSLLRGADLSKCLARPDLIDNFEQFAWIMNECFQSDEDVAAIINTIKHHYGPLEVYLTSDESNEESLLFFQVTLLLHNLSMSRSITWYVY